MPLAKSLSYDYEKTSSYGPANWILNFVLMALISLKKIYGDKKETILEMIFQLLPY